MTRSLAPGEVHIYRVECDADNGAAEWLELLSPEELDRHRHFVFEKDRSQFLRAHALTRLVLGRYTGRDPKSLEFEQNQYGKPRLRADAGELVPGFNLSHTHGMVALAVANEDEIGIDVEDTRRTTDWACLTERVFTPEERDGLSSCPLAQRQQRFYELWTLKEAYIKARGMGLSLPLKGFSMQIQEAGPIGINFTEAIADDPAEWQFELFPVVGFRMAVAIRKRDRRPWTIRCLPFAFP